MKRCTNGPMRAQVERDAAKLWGHVKDLCLDIDSLVAEVQQLQGEIKHKNQLITKLTEESEQRFEEVKRLEGILEKVRLTDRLHAEQEEATYSQYMQNAGKPDRLERLQAIYETIKAAEAAKGGGMRYRKKPVVIEAEQFHPEVTPWPFGVKRAKDSVSGYNIETLEGWYVVSVGDWIITGIKGERYPCKPDIFEQTYEAAEAEEEA